MTVAEFIDLGAQRLPTADELFALCDTLDIRVALAEPEKPVLRVPAGNSTEGQVLARLFTREPWRSQVIAASFERLLARLKDRGLSLAWQDDAPALVGPLRLQSPDLIAELRAHKPRLLEMLRPVPPPVIAPEPEPASETAAETHGNLVRLAGVNGWISRGDLDRPCECGNRVFRVMERPDGHQRIICARCVKFAAGEVPVGEIGG